jgi:monoamine oxidase
VLVLEARARVGGRTLNGSVGGGAVTELGGKWIAPDQTRLADFAVAAAELDRLAAGVPAGRPWAAPDAAALDGETVETWKLANASTAGGRFLLDLTVQTLVCAEPRDVSLLSLLAGLSAARDASAQPDLTRLQRTTGGAQDARFAGGSQQLSLRMARALGARVRLRTRVRRVVQSGRRVEVVADGLSVRCARVIVSGPPSLATAIDFRPALPADRAQLLQRFPQGSCIKVAAVYDEPFWRGDGLAGQAVGDADPVRVTYDNSPPSGRPGVLTGFIAGTKARMWGRRSTAARRAAVLTSLATYLGARAARPRAYLELDWAAEPWTRGCYAGFTPPGVLLGYGEAMRRPAGRVHWAGSEYAERWSSFMEGAVLSGEAVAADALAAL